mmetsp:Transcript_5371/g.15896  ORF Transcript_5371/g.15896 Transcript_5371/m.15896 type:complete len:82 (+) Transcript_5371:367-612(+)
MGSALSVDSGASNAYESLQGLPADEAEAVERKIRDHVEQLERENAALKQESAGAKALAPKRRGRIALLDARRGIALDAALF